jgi:hypothetical protein
MYILFLICTSRKFRNFAPRFLNKYDTSSREELISSAERKDPFCKNLRLIPRRGFIRLALNAR